jgi:hypothetical protein
MDFAEGARGESREPMGLRQVGSTLDWGKER